MPNRPVKNWSLYKFLCSKIRDRGWRRHSTSLVRVRIFIFVHYGTADRGGSSFHTLDGSFNIYIRPLRHCGPRQQSCLFFGLLILIHSLRDHGAKTSSILPVNGYSKIASNAHTQPLYWGSRSNFLLYKHWPFRPFDSITPQNSLRTRWPVKNCRRVKVAIPSPWKARFLR